MPRGKSRILGPATYSELYESFEEMPWDAIERGSKTQFTQQSKEEICACANEYPAAFAMLSKGAEKKYYAEVLELLTEIVSGTIELNEAVSIWVHPRDRSPEQTQKEQAFSVLNLAFNDGASIRDALGEMAASAEVIREILDNAQDYDIEPSAVEPRTAGLAAFISEALKGADAHPARGNDSWGKTAHEFSRWGISIGPQSTRFLTFSSAVLGQEFPKTTLRAAFKLLRIGINPKHPHFSKISEKK